MKDFNFRFVFHKNKLEFNEKLSYCLNRMYRQLITSGKPVGGVYHCLFKYNNKTRIFGSFVISSIQRFLFFPGAYPMLLDDCKSPIDHITLESDFSSIHFKMMDRTEKALSFPGYLHVKEIALWFTIILDNIEKYPLFCNPGFSVKVPSSDYERRKKEVSHSLRRPHFFSLEKIHCREDERISATVLLSNRPLTQNDFSYYNHIGITKEYEQISRTVIVSKLKNLETPYNISVVFCKVRWVGEGEEPLIKCLFLRKKSIH